ncbi:MAG: sulfurtransferase TusA family protein [Cyanobacteria bacterium]|nr:sulfurtransferase TusA family protein [Cyanobacteriota bacterium]MDA0867427.1 sulfurtransferase TusA family protein [Cyanobacteriota bacterium]
MSEIPADSIPISIPARAPSAAFTVDAHLDLRGTPCPINFVRTKLRLEQMAAGSLLEVWLDQGEPVEQVPDSLTMGGYKIEQLTHRDGFAAMIVRKPEQ